MLRTIFFSMLFLAVLSCKKETKPVVEPMPTTMSDTMPDTKPDTTPDTIAPDYNVENIDSLLFAISYSDKGFVWYKNSDAFLEKSSGTGHSGLYLRTRYNPIAAKKLDAAGKVKENTFFEDGSLIVKELVTKDSVIFRYVVLLKDSKNKYADNRGWVWGYINSNGVTSISAKQKGQACISCHSQQGEIDYQLMNKFFP